MKIRFKKFTKNCSRCNLKTDNDECTSGHNKAKKILVKSKGKPKKCNLI